MRRLDPFRLAAAAALAAALLAGTPGAGAPRAAAQDAKDPAPPPKKDDRPVSGDDAALAAIERFQRDFKSGDEGRRMNAIQSLGMTKNDLVTKELGKLLSHPNVEVRMAAAMVLDGQYQNTALAGEYLRKSLGREDDAEVLISVCLSLGRILYRESIPDLGEVIQKNGNVFVKIEGLKTFGKMKDTRALVPILDLWLVNPQGYSWEGGEVHYDSGAPGDKDQKKAEQMYKEKYGDQKRKGAPPTMLKTYIQAIADAVEKICGEKLSTPTELMQWMVKHEAELPYKLPSKVKTTLKEWQERAAKKAKDREKDEPRK